MGWRLEQRHAAASGAAAEGWKGTVARQEPAAQQAAASPDSLFDDAIAEAVQAASAVAEAAAPSGSTNTMTWSAKGAATLLRKTGLSAAMEWHDGPISGVAANSWHAAVDFLGNAYPKMLNKKCYNIRPGEWFKPVKEIAIELLASLSTFKDVCLVVDGETSGAKMNKTSLKQRTAISAYQPMKGLFDEYKALLAQYPDGQQTHTVRKRVSELAAQIDSVRRKCFFLAPPHKHLIYLLLVWLLVEAKHDFLKRVASMVCKLYPELASKIQQQIRILKDLASEAEACAKGFDLLTSRERRGPLQVDTQGIPYPATNGDQAIQGRAKRAFDEAISLIHAHAARAGPGALPLADLVSARRLPVAVRASVVQAEFEADVPIARAASKDNVIAVSGDADIPFTPGCKYTLRLGDKSKDLISQDKILEAGGFQQESDLAVFASVSGCDYANPMFSFQAAWDLVVYLSRRLPNDLEDRAQQLLDLYTEVVDAAIDETIETANERISNTESRRVKERSRKTLAHWRNRRARPHDSQMAFNVFMHGIESNNRPSASLSELLEIEGITSGFGIAPVQVFIALRVMMVHCLFAESQFRQNDAMQP
ncbi:hypothetical protein BC831DRAFT_469557 [Entophlyctis helioformis]|nr:hypothetical protein BC831DRAFT_469557 [Entophlyctis helioformis]